MKIGLFGGTFDPIHWGHLRNAEEVREAFSLDRLLFIPAGIPPHKRMRPTTPVRALAAMGRLATPKTPGFPPPTVELPPPGKSSSIDTVRDFAKSRGPKDSLYF